MLVQPVAADPRRQHDLVVMRETWTFRCSHPGIAPGMKVYEQGQERGADGLSYCQVYSSAAALENSVTVSPAERIRPLNVPLATSS